mmetsp:Transcript_6431/g.10524  ORF Transcript_6431/g.10524 Transcript_6431/m.10524 type:complete len:476 (-) Transcript_6431:116-1543(-)
MALEESERNRLEGKKEEEKQNAEDEMYATFSKLHEPSPLANFESIGNHRFPTSNVFENEMDDIDDNRETEEVSSDGLENSQISVGSQSGDCHMSATPEIDEDSDLKYIPPPRVVGTCVDGSSAKVNINFTPRVFPTPMRESTQANEEDWIAKNRKHLKKHGTLGRNMPKGNGIDVTEEDPAWLKAKGDDFYRVGDFLSAMNAYSAALDIDESMVSCYSNRSACYLKLSSPHDCKSDCSQAIVILEQDAKDDSGLIESTQTKVLLKLLMRRGVANCQMGLYKEATNDYQECLRILLQSSSSILDISAKNLQSDIEKLSQLEKADNLKKNADTKFSQSDISDALKLYSDALLESPLHVGCLSNRAACKIATRDFCGCIRDCSLALDIFDSDDSLQCSTPLSSGSSEKLSMLTAILPAKGSDKRKSWYLKTLVRRGAAHFQAGNVNDAILDYSKACAIDPTNNSLKTDLNNLRNSRSM